MVEKLTLGVHPFWMAKHRILKNGGVSQLSTDPFGGQEDPVEQLRELGVNAALAQEWGNRLPAYCRAVEKVADGILILIRSEQYDVHLELERLFFDHARKTVPHDRLFVFPDFDVNVAREIDILRTHDGIVSVSELIGQKCRAIEHIEHVQLFAFGETAEVCVPDEVIKVHRRFDMEKRATILSPYTFSETGAPVEQAIKDYLSLDRERRMAVVNNDDSLTDETDR